MPIAAAAETVQTAPRHETPQAKRRDGSEETRNQRGEREANARARNPEPAPELLKPGHAPLTARAKWTLIGDLDSAERSGPAAGKGRRSDPRKRAG